MQISRRVKHIGSWVLCGLWAVFLGVCSVLDAGSAAAAEGFAAGLLEKTALALGLSAQAAASIGGYTPYILQIDGYMLLGLLIWNALRFHLGRRSSLILALAGANLEAVLGELAQILVPGREPRTTDWLLEIAGAFCLLGGIWLFQWMWDRFPRLVNRETVSYVVFGVLTTVVNIVTYQVCYTAFPFSDIVNNTVSNTLAWILSVLFAYIVNKVFVFQSKTRGPKELLWEAGKFIGARLFSFAVDMAGMLLLVNLIHFHSGLSKVAVNVIVMIMNYFFSKWFIFKAAKKETQAGEPE